ncbi:MAG: hypothetical protein IJV17_00305 [Prevotella sp.]|nr:hypothetical protein [Prevotella sp.]
MEKRRLHIGWLLAISCWLLVVGCSSDGTGERQPAVLTVYVYSPEHPMLIRAAVGSVSPSVAESRVNKLQIWVFESNTGRKVGYLETTETSLLNTGEGATFQVVVDDAFSQQKPDVDIYVLANIEESNCGDTLNENSTREALREAKLDETHFGLSPLITAVPVAGLPMAGLLRNQPVIGDAPVLRIGSRSNLATVSLTRAVSKVRFVFANTTNTPTLSIKKIQLNAGMIPNEEYLIPQSRTLAYNDVPAPLLPTAISEVQAVENPTIYIYSGQEAQAYEDFITESELTKTDPYYLHESDKQLEGTITYTLGDGGEQVKTFRMEAAGDFLRNHTWIVYAYHAGGGFLQLNALYVKDWNNNAIGHEIYNW